MLIFGSDDNDDDLDLEGVKKTTPSPSSSLPTKPTTRSPFGSSGDKTSNVPAQESKNISLPPRKPTPFGQQPVPSQRPVRPTTPSEAPDSAKGVPPFAKPKQEEVAAPPAPSLSAYLPPARKSEQLPLIEETPQGERSLDSLSESEQFLRTMKEHAEARAIVAKQEEEARAAQAAQTQKNAIAPVQVPAPSLPTEVVSSENADQKGKKKGFFAPAPKKASKSKKAVPVKASRENKYDGDRKKILYIRLIAGSVAAVIGIAGMQAIFLPSSGPSKAQVMAAAKEAVNYTGFPTVSGEQFSIDFAKAYFNFDSKQPSEERLKSLGRFASTELVKQIDIDTLSPQEFEAVKPVGQSYNDYSVSESIIYGPYVVATNNLSAESAVFTVKVGLKSGGVVYLDVPVKYDPKAYSLTLAGPPSFSKPIQNQGQAEKSEWTTSFEGGGDDEIEKSSKSDFEAYLSAWALSDSTIVNRYVLDSATDNAKRGLQSSVRFNKIIDLQVEPLSEDRPSTATSRRVEINVMWEDPKTSLRYPQQYRMLIGKNAEGKWAIYDIENFSVLN